MNKKKIALNITKDLLHYANIQETDFVKKYTRIIEEETRNPINKEQLMELSQFSKTIPDMFRIHQSYSNWCDRAAFGLFRLLLPKFQIELRIIEKDRSDLHIYEKHHAYCTITLGGVKFILDVALTQFGIAKDTNGKNISLGVALLPTKNAYENSKMYQCYIMNSNDSGIIDNYSILFKEGIKVENRGYSVQFQHGQPIAVNDKGLYQENIELLSQAVKDMDPRIRQISKR